MGAVTGFRPALNPSCLTRFQRLQVTLICAATPTNLTDVDSDLGSTPQPSFVLETIRLGMQRRKRENYLDVSSCYNQGYSYFSGFQVRWKFCSFKHKVSSLNRVSLFLPVLVAILLVSPCMNIQTLAALIAWKICLLMVLVGRGLSLDRELQLPFVNFLYRAGASWF